MPKVPHFSCRCRLSELPARARQVAQARTVRRTDVLTLAGLVALLLAAACTSRPLVDRHPAAAPSELAGIPHGLGLSAWHYE